MRKHNIPAPLILNIISLMLMNIMQTAIAGNTLEQSDQRWQCHTAHDADARKQQVISHVMPRVAFAGETQAVDIETRMTYHQSLALSVAVIHNGKLDWSAAWGHLTNKGPQAGCDSLFQAGSLAKPATVLAAFRMQQDSLLDFDKPISNYLSSWQLPTGQQTDEQAVTLRNLLMHTAGITPGGYMGYAQGQLLPTDQQTVQGVPPSNATKAEVIQIPNTKLSYSGGGYTIVEIALQDLLDQPFAQIMNTWLINPVRMKQATFAQPLPDIHHGHTARGHLADGSVVVGGWHNHPEQAAAGLWATASDLAALLIEMRKGWQGQSAVFTRESITELLDNPVVSHSYGFRLIGEDDQLFITHYGGTVGYRSGMTLNLQSGAGAVYLINSNNGIDLGREFLSAVARTYNWTAFPQVWAERTTLPLGTLSSFDGQYQFDGGPTISVTVEDEVLTIIFPNGDRYMMTPIKGKDHEFIHAGTAVRARFYSDDTGLLIELYGQTGHRLNSEAN
ncbi:MAG: hypothetical protein Tsb002_32080 [Wenzhouxiangellaceae bacterium]